MHLFYAVDINKELTHILLFEIDHMEYLDTKSHLASDQTKIIFENKKDKIKPTETNILAKSQGKKLRIQSDTPDKICTNECLCNDGKNLIGWGDEAGWVGKSIL